MTSQLRHAAHHLLQLQGECHVAFDAELARHERHGRLQLPCVRVGNMLPWKLVSQP